MILRRFALLLRKQEWVAITIDFIIVVLGVFLGLQASNWNADRLAHQQGETYRSRIIGDLKNNVADLQGRTDYFGQVKTFALRALNDLNGSAHISDEAFLIAAYQATQIYTRPLSRSAYDEVLSVGALNVLGDVPTREKISNYYVATVATEIAFSTVTDYRDIIRRAIPYNVQERVRSACAEVLEGTEGQELGRLVLPEHCSLGLEPDVIARAAIKVRSIPELDMDTTRLLADLDQKLIQAARSAQRAQNLSADLRRLSPK
jgi:hypothetical protein